MKPISDKLKQDLIKIREALFNTGYGKFGNIVFDTRNNEFGISVGEINYKDEPINRILVVTIDTESGGSRIRYTPRRYLRVIKDPKILGTNLEEQGNMEMDLRNFCRDQCLFECDKDCILYKYKNKKL